MSDSQDDEDRVGYGRPPKHSRFRKGQSGNPNGRRKSGSGDAVQRVAQRKITVTENGRQRRIEVEEAVAARLASDGLKGNPASAKAFLALAREPVRQVRGQAEEEKPPVNFIVEHAQSLALDALQVLGALDSKANGRQLLLPWVVKLLVSRRSLPLGDEERAIVERGTAGGNGSLDLDDDH